MDKFCLWYLDSACSRHILGNKSLFNHLEPTNGDTIAFGDGSKAIVKGKWSINISGLPTFKIVLYVNGLKANLLSISICQFHDKNYSNKFYMDDCNV